MDPLKKLERLAAGQRVQLNSQDVRKNYYEAGDGIQGLKDAAAQLPKGPGRTAVIREVRALEKAHSHLHQALNFYYLWD